MGEAFSTMNSVFHAPRSFSAALLIAIAAVTLPFFAARGVEDIGENTNPTINTTAAGTSFNGQTFAQPLPWYNVGQVGDSSGVYLGDIGNNGEYWVIAAYHVAMSLPASATFNGFSYSTVAGSYVRLSNPDSSATDLVLFQLNISANPTNLVTLTLSNTTPSVGTNIYYEGFSAGTTQRWGYNQLAGYYNGPDGFGNIAGFTTNYFTSTLAGYPTSTALSSNPNEAQAVGGDSGGAAFIYNSTTSSWELGGVMLAVDDSDTPNSTVSADIATYDPEIITVVPEPGTVWEFAGGAVLLGAAVMLKKRLRAGRA